MISYQPELMLFENILRQFNLSVSIRALDSDNLLRKSAGLMTLRGNSGHFAELENKLKSSLKDKFIYHLKDEFFCHYSFLLLPEYPEKTVLVVGPYVSSEKDSDWIRHFIEEHGISDQWLSVIESYYRDVPCLNNQKFLYAALNSLGERLWGLHQFSSEEIVFGVPESCMPFADSPDPQFQEDIIFNIKKAEARYESENQFMQAISQGRSHRAEMMLSNFSKAAIENRTDPIRNIKNYSIILNTLMRKAAEQGGVHPIHIDRLSSDFARKIETTALWDQFMELWQDMARKYCLLVKNHSTKDYSQIVQHIIARVDFDLTADLSLKANAEALNVNASYLSSLFRKETGLTLTDYVNRKRIEHAVYLLNTTDLPVASIGQRCGIQDDNYFTKIFKKYIGITPKQYRSEHRHFGSK